MKLLVINARGLQAGAVGPYGNRWTETFALDTLAAGGVVFDQHLAVHPCPALARQTWRTGCYHFSARGNGWPDLLDVLHRQGVTTRLVLDAGRGEFADFAAGWQHVETSGDSEGAVRRARALLEEAAGSWLIWLDLAALLPPWRVPEEIVRGYFSPAPAEEDEAEEEDEEGEEEEQPPLEPYFDPPPGPIDPDDDDLYLRIRETYAAAISHLDGQLARLLDGLPDDVHVLVTSEAGQPLGEHGVVGMPPPSLHEEVVHVPLIAYGPGCRAGRHVEVQTASIDLAPTVADLAGASLEGAHGRSLVPLFARGQTPLRDYAVLGVQSGDVLARGLRSPGWALLLPVTEGGTARLYVKPDDLWEVNDVAKQHFEQAEALERTLREFLEASGGR
jgi:arylsulfatase A-like enzyme